MKTVKMAREEKNMELFPKDIDSGVMFIFSDEKEYYIDSFILKEKNETPVRYGKYYVKLGTYQDCVHLFTGDSRYLSKFKFQFFPYKDNRLKFCSWQSEYEPVFIYNASDKELEVDVPYGSYLIPPRTRIRCDIEETKHRIGKPVAPAIDKHNVNDVYVFEDGHIAYGQGNNDPQITYVKNGEREEE